MEEEVRAKNSRIGDDPAQLAVDLILRNERRNERGDGGFLIPKGDAVADC
jgi:hypothetical protein